MASSVHLESRRLAWDWLRTDSGIKIMVLQSSYDAVDDPTVDFVDSGGANDPIDHEANCTGYPAGFGNRFTLNSRTLVVDDANLRVEFDFADVALGALGNGTNNTLGGVGLIKEITNDTLSPFIAWDDTGNILTNGSTVTYQVASEGMIYF